MGLFAFEICLLWRLLLSAATCLCSIVNACWSRSGLQQILADVLYLYVELIVYKDPVAQ